MLIMGWTIKDPSSTAQLVGRIRSEDGKIVDLVHSFSSFTKHWKNRSAWYLEHGGKIVEVKGPVAV